MEDSFDVTHSWGDPRDPEKQNGQSVSFAIYKQEQLTLRFRISYEIDPDSNKKGWVIAPPKDIRQALGRNWSKRSEIYDRVVKHVKNIEFNYQTRMAEGSFSSLELDLSGVKGWLPTKIEEIKRNNIWLTYTLPSKNTFIVLLIGYLVYITSNIIPVSAQFQELYQVSLTILGVSAIVLLFKDILKDYRVTKTIIYMQALVDRSINVPYQTIRLMLRHYNRRYTITILLAVYLVFCGVQT